MAGHQNLLRFGVHWQQQDCSRNLERKEGFHLKCYNSVIASLHFHHSLYTETGICFLFLFWNQTNNLKWRWNSLRICGNILHHPKSNLYEKTSFLNLDSFSRPCWPFSSQHIYLPRILGFWTFHFFFLSLEEQMPMDKKARKVTPLFLFRENLEFFGEYTQHFIYPTLSWRTACSSRKKSSAKSSIH